MLGVVVRERGAGGSEETGAVVRRRGRPNPQNPGPVVPAFGGYPPKPRQRAAEGASVYSDTREQRARTPPVAARSQHRGTFARAGQPTAHICRAPHSKPARCAQQMSLPTSSALHNRLDTRFVHSSPPGVPAAASSEQRLPAKALWVTSPRCLCPPRCFEAARLPVLLQRSPRRTLCCSTAVLCRPVLAAPSLCAPRPRHRSAFKSLSPVFRLMFFASTAPAPNQPPRSLPSRTKAANDVTLIAERIVVLMMFNFFTSFFQCFLVRTATRLLAHTSAVSYSPL